MSLGLVNVNQGGYYSWFSHSQYKQINEYELN